MRILVTGSRIWEDQHTVWAALDETTGWPTWPVGRHGVTVIHGHCPTGADAQADLWTYVRRTDVERHRAHWGGQCQPECPPGHRLQRGHGSYCPTAGFRRNADMVALGADICLAFIRAHSRGATHTADLAEKAGIPTKYWEAA